MIEHTCSTTRNKTVTSPDAAKPFIRQGYTAAAEEHAKAFGELMKNQCPSTRQHGILDLNETLRQAQDFVKKQAALKFGEDASYLALLQLDLR